MTAQQTDQQKESNGSVTHQDEKASGEESSGTYVSGGEGDRSQGSNHRIITKQTIRRQIWTKMDRMGLVLFPRPCTFRIPHFKGDTEAAKRLTELDIFTKATVVKVGLDKALEAVRLNIVETRKELIVGCAGLREAVFLHVTPPAVPTKFSNHMASTRVGICHIGSALDLALDKKPSVCADLIVVGSVAVDRTGRRIGKGEGFSDLEYALLKKLGGIADNAPIVTVVHDMQVVDKLSEDVFKSHDVPCDWIVTPTQVIEVEPKREHPQFSWTELTQRRVDDIPILKQLLDKEMEDGEKVVLKEEAEDENGGARQRRQRPRRISGWMGGGRRRRVSAPERLPPGGRRHMSSQRDSSMPPRNSRSTRTFRRRRFTRPMNPIQGGDTGGRRMRPRLGYMRPRYRVEFSLKVAGLTCGVRVRDLKAALSSRGVRPRDISWLSGRGVAFLHFARPTVTQRDANNILQALQDLKVTPSDTTQPETCLKVEQARPVRRPQLEAA